MTTYRCECWSEIFEISADFSQASSSVNGDCHGRQVADFHHSPTEAMRSQLEECARMGGDDPDEDEDIAAEIESALEAMVEVGSPEDAEQSGFDRIGETDCYVNHERLSDYDRTTWRIGADEVDSRQVFESLVDGGMTVKESVEAMSEDGPSDHVIIPDLGLDEVYGDHNRMRWIYKFRGEIIVVWITDVVWDMDLEEAAEYAEENWDVDSESILNAE